METPSQIHDLIARLEEARAAGRPLTPEEVCRDHPELIDQVRDGHGWLRRMMSTMGGESFGTQSQPVVSGSRPAPAGYEILGEVGRGGMGVVYRARDLRLNRIVALKMVLAGAHASPEQMARFQAEAQAVAALKHPHIVTIHELGQHDGLPFFTLEFCPEGSLSQRIEKSLLEPVEAVRVLEPLARAMAHAHAAGIVHRDLKPQNVLIAEGGTPKVTDFGLVKRLGDAAGLTATGDALGTPSYMAPEQAAGEKEVGAAADVWSLGAILYRLLAGRPPFQAASAHETINQVLRDEPAPLRQLNRSIPRDLDTICQKCLRKDPRQRYDGAAELADDLGRFLNGEPIRARPMGRVERGIKWARRNRAQAGLLATVTLVALIGTPVMTWLWWRAEDDRRSADQALTRLKIEQTKLEQEQLATANALQAETESRQVADRTSGLLVDMFRASDPMDFLGAEFALPAWEQAEKRTVRQVLDDAAARLEKDKGNLPPLVRSKLLGALGNSYRNMGMFKKAAPLLSEAQRLRLASPAVAVRDAIQGEFDLALLDMDVGKFDEARQRLVRVVKDQVAAGISEQEVATARFYLALTQMLVNDPGAEAQFLEVIAARRRGGLPAQLCAARYGLTAYYLDQQRTKDAQAMAMQVFLDLPKLPEGRARSAGQAVFAFAIALLTARDGMRSPPGQERARKLQDAERKFRDCLKNASGALPRDHLYLCIIQFHLAQVLNWSGRDAEADREYRDVLKKVRLATGMGQPRVLVVVADFADFLARTKQRAEARALFAEVGADNAARFGAENSWRTELLLRMAEFEVESDEVGRAADHAREALDLIRKGKFHAGRSEVAYAFRVANALSGRTHDEVAVGLQQAIRPAIRRLYGDPSEELVMSLRDEGRCRLAAGKSDAAESLLKQAESLARQLKTPLSLREERLLVRFRAEWEWERGRPASAEAHFRKSLDVARKLRDKSAERRDSEDLVGVLCDQGRYAEAAPFAENAARAVSDGWAGSDGEARALALLATVRLAAGDRAGHKELVAELDRKFGRSGDPAVLTKLALAGGLAPAGKVWTPEAVASRLETALVDRKNVAGSERALALLRLRAGNYAGAAAAIAPLGPRKAPADLVVLGLAAAGRHDQAETKRFLEEVEELTRPVATQAVAAPVPARQDWWERLRATILINELRRAVDPKGN